MYHISIDGHDEDWRVLHATERSQAAIMTLDPGERTGGPENRHPEADQWLYVLDGSGTVRVADREQPITAGSLLLIAAGERHEVRNTGDLPLRTINIYAPPEYET